MSRTAAQSAWIDHAITQKPVVDASRSWWIGQDRASFSRQAAIEFDRIRKSTLARKSKMYDSGIQVND